MENKSEWRRRAALEALRAYSRPLSENEISAATRIGGSNLSHALVGLLHAGLVRYVGNKPKGLRPRYMWQAV